jgi:hypothetical protein
VCLRINEAAVIYHVPAKLIIAVLQVEQGRVGHVSKNTNGTYDIGPAQINSSWLPELKKYGFTKERVLLDPCINAKIGAWILGRSIASEDNLLVGVGNYNSHTPVYNHSYYQKVRVNFTKLHVFLS